MSNSARLAEAKACEQKAAECLKTSMIKLKFKPDFDGAATHLSRASVCYKNAGDMESAAKALKDAGNNYEQNGNTFHAAQSREGAAMILRDLGKHDDAFKLFEEAIEGYATCGSLDTAAMSVEKAAKAISNADPDKAVKLYQRGLALVQQSDRSKMASEFLSQITKLSLKLSKFPEAAAAIKDEIEKYVEVKESPRIGQLAIGLVLVNLAMEDVVAATKWYGWTVHQCPDFELTDDAKACQQLIYFYEQGDDDSFQNVLKSGVLRSMDNEYLRLQRVLKAPQSETATSGNIVEDNEDEDDLN